MNLKVIGSNSAGNCYLLQNESETLVIECGLNFQTIKQALNFQLNKVVGCLVSHEHLDHCKGVVEAIKAGISIYATAGTHKAMKTEGHHRAKPIRTGEEFQLGGFKILPFDVKHDAEEPVGFMIHHEETGNILFLTDSYYVPFTFRNLHNIIIECNYSKEIIDRKVTEGASPEFLRNRIFKSHMNLETLKGVLKANDLSTVNNIVLIHLSDSNSDAAQFHREISTLTGKTVHVADAGLLIENFNHSPF